MQYRLRTLLIYASATVAMAAIVWFGAPLLFGEKPPLALIVIFLVIGLTSAVRTSRIAR